MYITIVIDEKLELSLRKPKVLTECGKLNIELKELSVKEYFSNSQQSGSSNNQTTQDPTNNPIREGINNLNLSEEDEELRALAQLINMDSDNQQTTNRSNTTNLSSSPRGNSQALSDHNQLNTPVGSSTPQSTPSLSTTSSPQPPPQTIATNIPFSQANSESWLLGADLANHVAQQGASGQSNLTTPNSASNGPTRTGG